MTIPIRVSCPKCRAAQDVAPDEMGRERICGQCQSSFTPSAAPSGVEKVLIECPGCHRPLKVRTEYLGKTLTCKYCDRPFVARAAGREGGSGSVEVVPEERVVPWGGQAAWEREVAALEERIEALAARLDPLDREAIGRETRLDELANQIASDRQSIWSAIEGLEAEKAELGGRVGSLDEATREGLAAVRGEVVNLGGRLGEWGGRADRAEARLVDLGSRVEALDASAVKAPDWRGRVEAAAEAGRLEAARALEAAREEIESARLGLVEEFERRIGQSETGRDALARALDAERSESGAALEAIRAELTRLAGRQAASEEALACRADPEGRLVALGEEFGRIREELGGRDSEIRALREELERGREEQAGRLRAALEEGQALRAEVASLREELARKPEPAAPEAPAPVVPPRVTLSKAIVGTASPGVKDPLGLRALDLAFDLLDGGQAPPAGRGDARADYDGMAARFGQMMRERLPAEIVPEASRIVEFTRTHFGEDSSEHALALRNLAILLPSQGEAARAEALLNRAREICRQAHGLDHPSYGVCQLDLAELNLIRGESARARILAEQALGIFLKTSGPDSDLAARARHCLGLAEARPGGAADRGLSTVSITT